ncbi:MAG: hypothetical protein GY809_25275 [Planctomycetes bacterium]|nr:hypothetical protein [Planctomycetota bacterium]
MKQKQTRRSLFIRGLRQGTLAVLAAGTGVVWTKRRRLVREGKCVGQGVCSGCSDLSQCGLPLALSTKRYQQKRSQHDAG